MGSAPCFPLQLSPMMSVARRRSGYRDSPRNSLATMYSGQSHLRRIVTAHSVDSAPGGSRRRANVCIASRCRIAAPCRTKEKLAKIEDPTPDVSSDQVGVHLFQRGRGKNSPGENAVAEARCKPF